MSAEFKTTLQNLFLAMGKAPPPAIASQETYNIFINNICEPVPTTRLGATDFFLFKQAIA
ncbi:MAG: hypothetical protein EA343_18635 [Nodularia sp. (in: Bacteria)]|nr:MAG: hypothetical protein EA343_18635 [Nodularia sp. (in: cyanobacteria)]